jgi:alpha-glucosidase
MRILSVCRHALLLVLAGTFLSCASEPTVDTTTRVTSPDGQIEVTVTVEEGRPRYAVTYGGESLIQPSSLGYDSLNTIALDRNFEIASVERREQDTSWTPLYGTTASVRNHHREMAVTLRQTEGPERRLRVVFRVFNDGVAFRYVVPDQEGITAPRGAARATVYSENTGFNFGGNYETYVFRRPPEGFYGRPSGGENSSYEGVYRPDSLGTLQPGEIVAMPLLVNAGAAWVAVSEANLTDYAGLYLEPTGETGHLTSLLHPEYRLTGLSKNYTGIGPTDWKVKSDLPLRSPWRVLMIGEEPGHLIESNLLTTLSDPSVLQDTSWIEPGLAVWPWWNGRYTPDPDVPNEQISVPMLKYYIDFARESDVPYILIDLGWPEIDIQEVIRYAKAQGVEFFLWVEEAALREGRLDSTFQTYQEWGAAGVKVDFIFPDQQGNVQFLHDILESAGRHRLMVNVHGVHKPTGIRRTYPHFLTREGVLALEFSRKNEKPTPEHNVTLPFTRGLLGPMDYTPGAFDPDGPPGIERKVQTTRMQQMAMYVVYYSPLQMIPGYPDSYAPFPEAWRTIRTMPTVWDETRFLQGRPADYVVLARRKGDTWYVGAMTDESARTLEVPLDFLPDQGTYAAQIFQDGPPPPGDPHRGVDVRTATVSAPDTVTLDLAAAGGGVAVLQPQ